jgi:hypothetical protein
MRALQASTPGGRHSFEAVAACSAFALTVRPKRYSRDLSSFAEFACDRIGEQSLWIEEGRGPNHCRLVNVHRLSSADRSARDLEMKTTGRWRAAGSAQDKTTNFFAKGTYLSYSAACFAGGGGDQVMQQFRP